MAVFALCISLTTMRQHFPFNTHKQETLTHTLVNIMLCQNYANTCCLWAGIRGSKSGHPLSEWAEHSIGNNFHLKVFTTAALCQLCFKSVQMSKGKAEGRRKRGSPVQLYTVISLWKWPYFYSDPLTEPWIHRKNKQFHPILKNVQSCVYTLK